MLAAILDYLLQLSLLNLLLIQFVLLDALYISVRRRRRKAGTAAARAARDAELAAKQRERDQAKLAFEQRLATPPA